jgi:hypothetical protein
MPNKEIKLKLTLNSIVEYDGGAEAFLNDIKNAGVIIHRDDEGFLMTSDCVGKYSAYTESVSNLNELDHLVVYDVNDNEIGKLKIDFLELDDSLYNIPEGSTFEETELIIGFLEPETYTILFTNLTHPEFDIALPEPMTVVEGESAALPSVEGEYEDTEYIYTPESWNIGAFESEITPTEDMTANLVWHSEAKIIEHTITFTNTTHPEFEVEFPESITVEDGESVALPSVSGSFEDSGYEYTPLEWSIGSFGESFTPTENVTANLIWKAEINFNLKVYGFNGGAIQLNDENNFMYVFEKKNNRYIMLEGGTSSTIWEIIQVIDINGNEVSKESDYIWWINRNNIYYKASPTRSVSAAYILIKATPPIS